MDRQDKADVLAVALAAGAMAVTFLFDPHWGWLFAAISLIAFAAYFGLWKKHRPNVEDFPVHNALNFRITNNYAKAGLADSQLTLHSMKKWEPGRRQFCDASLPVKLPAPLYSDHCGLPYKVPRMFQLVEFINKTAPIVRVSIDSQPVEVALQRHGIWRFTMELRWAGGGMQIERCFRWDEHSLPMFLQETGLAKLPWCGSSKSRQ